MLNKESQMRNLVKGIVALGAGFTCKSGLRGNFVITCANTYSHSGAKRLWDLKKLYEAYLISDQFDNNPKAKFYSLEPAYEYIHRTRRYKLNLAFFNWLRFVYISRR